MNPALALEQAFRQELPVRIFPTPNLLLSYKPRESLSIARTERPPDALDIEHAISVAREAFIILAGEPERKVVEWQGVLWHVAQWKLKRESVADHLPLKKERVR